MLPRSGRSHGPMSNRPGPEAGPCKNNTSLTSEPPLAHFPAMCKVTGTGWCAARGVQEGGIPETGIAPNPAKD